MTVEEAVERAGKTLPTQAGIQQLAQALDPATLSQAFEAADHDLAAQVNLALAAVVNGVALPPAALAALAPDVPRWESLALLLAPEASRTAMLDALIAAPWTPIEPKACAVALRLHDAAPEDAPAAVAELRQMLRAELPSLFHDELILATGRRLREHDPHVALLYERATAKMPELHPEAIASPGRLADHVAKADLSVLPEHVERRQPAAAPKVGRNDPCPCGSGKKFKKCCGKPGATVAAPVEDPDRLRPDRRMSVEDLLREPLPILARLPFAELPEQTHLAVLSELAILRHLPGLVRATEAWTERPFENDERHDEGILAALLVLAAHPETSGRANEWVEALRLERSRDEARPLLAAAAPSTPGALAVLEEVFREGLDRPVVRTLDLAAVLVGSHPALAAFLMRGIALDAHPLDGQTAVDYVAYARDRLGAGPDDALPGVLRLLDRDDAHADAREARVAEEREARVALEEQLAELRAAMRSTRKANEALEAELEDGRRALERLEADDADEGAPAVDPEELRRLRTKVRELKGRIEEGKRERTVLRGQLDEAERTRGEAEPLETEPREDEEDQAEDEPLEPTRLRVPDWSSRARKSLAALPGSIAQQSIVLAAQLAAGDPLARRGAKKLEGFEHLRRARVGIHYRLLYVLHEDTLEVVDVLARENLDSHLGRLRKTIG